MICMGLEWESKCVILHMFWEIFVSVLGSFMLKMKEHLLCCSFVVTFV